MIFEPLLQIEREKGMYSALSLTEKSSRYGPGFNYPVIASYFYLIYLSIY